jgi:Kef-type K+ transport system membrane component KefB
MRRLRPVLLLAATAPLLMAAGEDPSARVVIALAVVLAAAVLGGDLAVRLGQPAVLGELVAGVLLGNVGLFGPQGFAFIAHDPTVDILSRIGVLILLFQVGLEATVPGMLKVGGASLLVAVLGVVAPFGLGWLAGVWLLPNESEYIHAFLGATLCATSVGITARVLKDLGRSQSLEARIILGAAVIDDVLGLVILAVVTGVIAAAGAGTSVSVIAVGVIVVKAVGFLAAAIVVGRWFSPRLLGWASRLKSRGVLLVVALAFCFLLSWLAFLIGLAAIVGAFAAGLVIEGSHEAPFTERGEHRLEELVAPLGGFLVPVFFVLMGMRTDLRAFAAPGVLGLAAALTVAAIAGKQVCALGTGKGVDRLSVGIGMIPRGEVGLIFANIGLGLTIGGVRVVSEAAYSALVVMVIVTTMITPPALAWSLRRRKD